MAFILTEFMYGVLQNIKMILGTKISATYVDIFGDALVAWKKLLQTVILNWFFWVLFIYGTWQYLYRVLPIRNKLWKSLCINSVIYITLDIIKF